MRRAFNTIVEMRLFGVLSVSMGQHLLVKLALHGKLA
jgi:hypothetical protein